MVEGTTDIDSLTERAKVIAKETGRDEADILQDLLDDGIINESNRPESLVDQLKDAAELIATVQHISKDIEKNTVLNGGDNKTKIKVESTIEGDIVDRAIESVQRKADKLKKLAATLIPILLLLAGGGAESMGWVDFLEGWGEDNEDGYYISCAPSWLYEDESYSEGQNIFIVFTFYDDHHCETEIDGHFIIEIYSNGSKSDDGFVNVGYFTDSVDVTYDFTDLDAGTYITEISLHEVSCETGVCKHADEWTIEQNPTFSIEECADDDSDGICNYDEIEGCTDDSATNYDSEATDDDGTCTYPESRCEITLYEISMQYNNTSAMVIYDLDCGVTTNNQDGFNVSVQFWADEANTTNTTNYTTDTHYIQGYEEDIHELYLINLTAQSYDFYWIAIWTDEEGEDRNLIEGWLDIEIGE